MINFTSLKCTVLGVNAGVTADDRSRLDDWTGTVLKNLNSLCPVENPEKKGKGLFLASSATLPSVIHFSRPGHSPWPWLGLKPGVGLEFGKVQAEEPGILLHLGGPLELGRQLMPFPSKLFILNSLLASVSCLPF